MLGVPACLWLGMAVIGLVGLRHNVNNPLPAVVWNSLTYGYVIHNERDGTYEAFEGISKKKGTVVPFQVWLVKNDNAESWWRHLGFRRFYYRVHYVIECNCTIDRSPYVDYDPTRRPSPQSPLLDAVASPNLTNACAAALQRTSGGQELAWQLSTFPEKWKLDRDSLVYNTRRVVISVCVAGVVLAMYTVVFMTRREIVEERRRRGECVECGYCLGGIEVATCPECGSHPIQILGHGRRGQKCWPKE